MRVTDLSVRLYRIPPPIRIQDSIQRVAHWEWIVTTVTTDAGLTGTGFAYTGGLGGTRDPGAGRHLPRARSSAARTRGTWSASGPAAGGSSTPSARAASPATPSPRSTSRCGTSWPSTPAFRSTGCSAGARDRIRAYGSGINMHLDGEPLLDQMRGLPRPRLPRREDEGRAGQPRGGRGARGRRPAAGGHRRSSLMLDANQKWTAGEAVRRAQMLTRFAPFWLEEPVLADDRDRALPRPARAPASRSRPARPCTRATSSPTSCGRRARRGPGRHRARRRLHRVAQDREARGELQPAGGAPLRRWSSRSTRSARCRTG